MLQSGGTAVEVTRFSPAEADSWSAAVQATDHANLAHAPEWFRAIHKAYGHTPLYLQAEAGDGRLAVLPAYVLRSRVFGSVLASMPFLDGGGPCSPTTQLDDALVRAALGEARRLGVESVELRSTVELDVPVAPSTNKVNMVLPLPPDPGRLWNSLDAKVRNQVRKAERSGLTVEFGHRNLLGAFYDVFAVNMRDLGSPVHARRFFGEILDAFGDRARVVLVRKDAAAIGGLVALAFKDTLVVPWASSLRRHFALCPNVLLYWETLAAACREGFARFDFGRSTPGSGTHRFKRQWRAEEVPLFHYHFPARGGAPRPPTSADGRGALLVALWKRLPVAITRLLGPRIRGHLTQ